MVASHNNGLFASFHVSTGTTFFYYLFNIKYKKKILKFPLFRLKAIIISKRPYFNGIHITCGYRICFYKYNKKTSREDITDISIQKPSTLSTV